MRASEHWAEIFIVCGIAAIVVVMVMIGRENQQIGRAEKTCHIRGWSDYDPDIKSCYRRVYESGQR